MLLSPVLLLLLLLLAHVSWSSRAVGLVPTIPAPLAPLWLRQRLAAPPTAGLARQRRQRLGWPSIAANGRLVTVAYWHIHHDFPQLQLSNANDLQVLLCALEEESAIKPVFSDAWVQMAKRNDIQICHHVINAPRGCWPNWNARGDIHRRCTANGWCWCCLRWCSGRHGNMCR